MSVIDRWISTSHRRRLLLLLLVTPKWFGWITPSARFLVGGDEWSSLGSSSSLCTSGGAAAGSGETIAGGALPPLFVAGGAVETLAMSLLRMIFISLCPNEDEREEPLVKPLLLLLLLLLFAEEGIEATCLLGEGVFVRPTVGVVTVTVVVVVEAGLVVVVEEPALVMAAAVALVGFFRIVIFEQMAPIKHTQKEKSENQLEVHAPPPTFCSFHIRV